MASIKGQPSPKPSSLPEAAPRSADEMSDEELMAATAHMPADAMSDEQLIAATNTMRAQSALPQGSDIGKSMTKQVLEGGARVADYGGGLISTGVAAIAGLASGQPNAVTGDDLKNALAGASPTPAQYMEKLGIGEGNSWKIPGTNKRISERDMSGFALSIAFDPLTALSKLSKTAPMLRKLMGQPGPIADSVAAVLANPVGTVADTAGRYVYRGTFGKLAEKVGPEAAEEVATRLLNEGGAPSRAASMAKAAEKISGDMSVIRDGFYAQADQLGAAIDLNDNAFVETEKLLNKWRKTDDPGLRNAVEALSEMLDGYKVRGKVSLSDASSFKTNLYNGLPDKAFQNGKPLAIAQRFKAVLAEDLKNVIVKSGNKAQPGLGTSIDQLNQAWGPVIEAQNPLAKQAAIEGRPHGAGQQIDAALIASHNIPAALARKAMELAQTPHLRRLFGKALMQAGQSGAADALARRGLVMSQRGNPAGNDAELNALIMQQQQEAAASEPQQ